MPFHSDSMEPYGPFTRYGARGPFGVDEVRRAATPWAAHLIEPGYTVYSLEHVDALEAAAVCNELFEAVRSVQSELSGTTSSAVHHKRTPDDVHFQADAETNSVVYWAPKHRESQIQALLEQLDRAFD